MDEETIVLDRVCPRSANEIELSLTYPIGAKDMLQPDAKGNLLVLTIRLDIGPIFGTDDRIDWRINVARDIASSISTSIFLASSDIYERMDQTIDNFSRSSEDGNPMSGEVVLHFPKNVSWSEIQDAVEGVLRRNGCLLNAIQLTERPWSQRIQGSERT